MRGGTWYCAIWYGAVVVKVFVHALHVRGKIGDGSLVSSQQRRATVVPKPSVNRWVFSSAVLNRISFVRASEESSRTVVLHSPEGTGSQGSIVSWANRPTGVPTRPIPPVICPGFGFGKWCSTVLCCTVFQGVISCCLLSGIIWYEVQACIRQEQDIIIHKAVGFAPHVYYRRRVAWDVFDAIHERH